MATANQPQQPPDFTPAEMLALYLRGENDRLSEQFLSILEHFRGTTYSVLTPQLQYYFSRLASTFLFIFSQPEYRIADRYVGQFISLNRTISNLMALSSTGTTDAYLEILRGQPANFAKILTLFSARNTVEFDRKALFDMNGPAASLWYTMYSSIYHAGLLTEVVWENLKEHFAFRHPGMKLLANVHEIYYGSTYVHQDVDRGIKECVNSTVKEVTQSLPPIRNSPKPNKIALISASWSLNHPVYRNYYAYVKALKEKYHLTFFQVGRYLPPEPSLFDEMRTIEFVDGTPNLAELAENDFQVVYFPDIGMSVESILLANLRLAPIQICSPGHSVSTFGADVDYYISGADVETPDSPEQNYSERLVLLPGMGVIQNRPLYERRHLKKDSEEFLIDGPWSCQKLNYPFLRTLEKLIGQVKRPVKLRLFAGQSSRRENDRLPFCRELAESLGVEHVQVYPALGYKDYMTAMEVADLSIDSYHFGGCNTVSDTLFLGVPTVTWEGRKWYNRIGSQMLRLAGIPECIATTEEEYLSIALRLIHDDDYRQSIRQKIAQADLDKTVFSTEDARYFLTAVDYLVANHERLKQEPDRKAIRIPPDGKIA